MDLKERAAWAIGYVSEQYRLSFKEIAERTGVNRSTVNSYKRGDSEPKASFIAAFCVEFGFNSEWLLLGKGEPFPGAKNSYPNTLGNESKHKKRKGVSGVHTIRSSITDDTQEPEGLDYDHNFARAVALLKDIFERGSDDLIKAFLSIVYSFSAFADMEDINSVLSGENKELRKQLSHLDNGDDKQS